MEKMGISKLEMEKVITDPVEIQKDHKRLLQATIS